MDVEVEAGAVGQRALGNQVKAEEHGLRDDRAERSHLDLHAVHATTGGVSAHRVDNTLGYRHLVHRCPVSGRMLPP